jgi:hypothetical protein
MKFQPAFRFLLTVCALGFAAAACQAQLKKVTGSLSHQNSPAQISRISLVGTPVIVFDHLRDKREPDNIPDAPVTAWKTADGTVNITIPSDEMYRMQGPDLEHLTMDPNKIFSSATEGSDIVEKHFNYHHWFLAPYTFDGRAIYVLTHTEWYACLLLNDCGESSYYVNSWENSNNSLVSKDGGASWVLNVVNGSHVVAAAGDRWTGSKELKLRTYHKATNHSGIFTPSRLIKEGDYYYSIGFVIHRDFGKLNLKTYEAPVDKYGYVLLRTADVTNPAGWEAWVSGTTFDLITHGDYGTFLPQQNGVGLNTSQPQIIFDTNTQTYIAIFTQWGKNGGVYYMTSKSLAAPVWSDAQLISGTTKFQADPRGPRKACNRGFWAGDYVSIIDTNSPGMNFEFTGGAPWMFYAVNPARCGGDNLARDLYRVQLSISYK